MMTTLFLNSEAAAAAMVAAPAAEHEHDAVAQYAEVSHRDHVTVVLRALCADSSVDHLTLLHWVMWVLLCLKLSKLVIGMISTSSMSRGPCWCRTPIWQDVPRPADHSTAAHGRPSLQGLGIPHVSSLPL